MNAKVYPVIFKKWRRYKFGFASAIFKFVFILTYIYFISEMITTKRHISMQRSCCYTLRLIPIFTERIIEFKNSIHRILRSKTRKYIHFSSFLGLRLWILYSNLSSHTLQSVHFLMCTISAFYSFFLFIVKYLF